jgi:hypothetical protein
MSSQHSPTAYGGGRKAVRNQNRMRTYKEIFRCAVGLGWLDAWLPHICREGAPKFFPPWAADSCVSLAHVTRPSFDQPVSVDVYQNLLLRSCLPPGPGHADSATRRAPDPPAPRMGHTVHTVDNSRRSGCGRTNCPVQFDRMDGHFCRGSAVPVYPSGANTLVLL